MPNNIYKSQFPQESTSNGQFNPNLTQYPQQVNMQAVSAPAQGLIPETRGAEFQHPHSFQQLPPKNSFPRQIILPTYGQTAPRLIRASSINNDEYLKNDDQNNKFLNLKVTLEFQGDISSMTMNWSPKEVEASRRLVAFGFKQHSNHLVLNFKPIDQSDYIPGTPVISCIYWNQTNKFYVTSVDLITLLEYLVNAKFPVEEKNRIRRNLQSLKPLTISKSNPKFYNFFQLIMNFQNPKPRHIEKDVKVLSWSTLRESLQKVLSKYTIDPTTDNGSSGGAYPSQYEFNNSRTNTSATSSTMNSNNSANSSVINPSSTSSVTSGINTLKGNNSSNQLYNGIPDASSFNYSLQPPAQEQFYPYYQYSPGMVPPPQGHQQQLLMQQQQQQQQQQQVLPLQPNSTPQAQQTHMNYQKPLYNQPHQVQYQLPTIGTYQEQQYQPNPQVLGLQGQQDPPQAPGSSQSAPPSNIIPQAPVPHQQNPVGQDLTGQGGSTPSLRGNNYNMYYYQ